MPPKADPEKIREYGKKLNAAERALKAALELAPHPADKKELNRAIGEAERLQERQGKRNF
jgi:hypothetical protein